uniref:Uncharacterized protein n=1 Tax=Cyprinus carpio TaxID=7962 RepID=A0A8C1PWJ8_CYPCA
MCLLLFISIFALGTFEFCSSGTLHAQCKVEWYFSLPCRSVYEALVTQRTKSGGQSQPVPLEERNMCLCINLQSASVHFISAKHTTPVKKYVDDINFRLVSCGFFTHCTNYCNLYNLIEGSGLTEAPGYKEITSDFLCTQRSSANCSVY